MSCRAIEADLAVAPRPLALATINSDDWTKCNPWVYGQIVERTLTVVATYERDKHNSVVHAPCDLTEFATYSSQDQSQQHERDSECRGDDDTVPVVTFGCSQEWRVLPRRDGVHWLKGTHVGRVQERT